MIKRRKSNTGAVIRYPTPDGKIMELRGGTLKEVEATLATSIEYWKKLQTWEDKRKKARERLSK